MLIQLQFDDNAAIDFRYNNHNEVTESTWADVLVPEYFFSRTYAEQSKYELYSKHIMILQH